MDGSLPAQWSALSGTLTMLYVYDYHQG